MGFEHLPLAICYNLGQSKFAKVRILISNLKRHKKEVFLPPHPYSMLVSDLSQQLDIDWGMGV